MRSTFESFLSLDSQKCGMLHSLDSWKCGLLHEYVMELQWPTRMEEVTSKKCYGGVQIEGSNYREVGASLKLDQCDSTLMILLRSWSREYRCCTQVNGCKSHIFRQAMLSSELSFLTMMLITRYISYWLIFCTLILTASKSVGSSTSLESLTPTQPEKRHFHLTP